MSDPRIPWTAASLDGRPDRDVGPTITGGARALGRRKWVTAVLASLAGGAAALGTGAGSTPAVAASLAVTSLALFLRAIFLAHLEGLLRVVAWRIAEGDLTPDDARRRAREGTERLAPRLAFARTGAIVGAATYVVSALLQ